jgi:hypothetical protein
LRAAVARRRAAAEASRSHQTRRCGMTPPRAPQSVVISVPSKAGSLPSLVTPAVNQYQVGCRRPEQPPAPQERRRE